MYVNPKLQMYASLVWFSFGNHKFIFYICKSVSAL